MKNRSLGLNPRLLAAAVICVSTIVSPAVAWTPPANPDFATPFAKATVWDVSTAKNNSGKVGRGNPTTSPATNLSELGNVSLRALQLYRYDPARILSSQSALGLSDFASNADYLNYVSSLVQLQIQLHDIPYTTTNACGVTSAPTTTLKSDVFVPGPYGRAVFLLKSLNPSALSALNPAAATMGETFEGTFVRRMASELVPQANLLLTRRLLGYGNRELSLLMGNFVLYRMYGNGSSSLSGLGLSALDLTTTQGYLAQNATIVENYWNDLMAHTEPDENSSNYTRIGLRAILNIADILGKTDADPMMNPAVADLSTSFYTTVAKNAWQVSPAGYLPIYGDSYFESEFLSDPPFLSSTVNPLTPPLGAWVHHTNTSFIYLVERVGRLAALNGVTAVSSSELLGIARKMWTQLKWFNANTAVLPEWIMTPNASATNPLRGSELLTYRPPVAGPSVDLPAKLVVRPASEPDAPMVLMDVATGDHSHPSKRGSIGYLEVEQSPLFYNYGRYLQGDYFGNQVVLRKTSGNDTFPLSTSSSTNVTVADLPISDGQWHTLTFNMGDFSWNRATPDASSIVHIDQLSLAVTASTTDYADIKFDNLRLVSRDGSSVSLINACDATTNWTGSDLSIDTADKTQGTGSLTIGLNSPCTGYSLRNIATLFPNGIDIAQYPYVRIDYKAVVSAGSHLPPYRIQLRFDGGPGRNDTTQATLASVPAQAHRTYDTWYYMTPHPVFDLATGATDTFVADVSAQQFSHGRATFNHYGTWDHTLNRSFALTLEGVLVIVDEISSLDPEGGATSWQAASLWQLYTPGITGTDWFSAAWEVPFPDVTAPTSPWSAGRGFVVKFGTNGGLGKTHLIKVPGVQLTNDDRLRRGSNNTPPTVNHDLNIALVQQPLTSGTVTLITVVAPQPRGQNNTYTQAIGNGIAITSNGTTGVTVTVAAYPLISGSPGIVAQNLTINRSLTGTWSVTRTP